MLTILSCSNNYNTKEWFDLKKSEILDFAKQEPDSITESINNDKSWKTVSHYLDGQIIYERDYNLSFQNLGLEHFYYPSDKSELRREICDNKNMGFEGLFLNGKAHGLSRWWDCNNQLIESGYRYKGKQVGIWKEYLENGKIVNEVDYDAN